MTKGPDQSMLYYLENKMPFTLFLWLDSKKAVLIWDNLQRRAWQGLSRCALYGSNEESTVHILLECSFSNTVWREIAR